MLTPLLLAAAAIACLIGAFVVLRSLGVRYRVGRLLAAAQSVEIDAAVTFAPQDQKYVKVSGRISSEEEFPDENDRPLVFRRKRLDIGDGRGGWRTIADEREAVPFGIETRGSFIAVDEAAIADGLVAIPREASGLLSDLPADLLEGLENLPSPETPARLLIEQLSAVEHATVCGTPALRAGQPIMTAGLGRPLIVTTLERADAMRLLATGHRPRVVGAAALLVVALGLLGAAALALIVGF